ncbi:MAG: tetratricopeptide repeat protein [Planctomycetaceae bacterium]|nr:tetratricopeptide repeat protein [Planctomycetaceae bacterium]
MAISMRLNRQVKHVAIVFVKSAIFLIFVNSALADDETVATEKEEIQAFSASHTIQVITDEAEGFLGEKSQGKVPLGTVYRYTEEKDGWLFVPRVNAWVRSDQVVPIERSESHFNAILNEKPNAEALQHRGVARLAQNETAKALEDFTEAIRLGLTTSSVFVNRGNAYYQLNDFRAAMDDYNRAIEIDVENSLAYNNRALVWAAMGNLDRAIEDTTHAIRLNPRYAEAYNNRGVTLRKQGDIDKAIRDYTEAIHHFESYGDAYANRGYARVQLGDYADALQDYYQAVTISPGSPQAFNDAAWLMATCPDEEFRNGERAVEYAKYACELTKHQNGEYVDTLAAALAETGDFESAVKTEEQAITLLDQDSREAAEARLQLFKDGKPFRVAR